MITLRRVITGETPASVTLLTLIDALTGNPIAIMGAGVFSGPDGGNGWSYAFTSSSTSFSYTYRITFSDASYIESGDSFTIPLPNARVGRLARAQIRNFILDHTNRDDKTDIADSSIDLAFDRLGQMSEWQQTRLEETVAITPNASSFALVTAVRRLVEIRLIDGVRSYEMLLMAKHEALGRYNSNPTAFPAGRPFFCYRETDSGVDTINFFPISNGSYSIKYTASFPPAIGPNDGDVANIPDSDECIIAFGTAYVFRSVGAFQMAQPWDQQFEMLAQRLILSDNRRPGQNTQAQLHDGLRGSRPTRYPSSDPVNDPFVSSWPPHNGFGYGGGW